MPEDISIDYAFRFENGALKAFNLRLDRSTLSFLSGPPSAPPAWAELNKNRCSVCALDGASHSFCPIALNLSGVAEEFRDYFAYENVDVTVSTEERTYSKKTTVQEGLSSLIGIIMVTSGCPGMELLKPMVRFHLPFATLPETIYRMASMYLLSQYFLMQEGGKADWHLAGIEEIYTKVGQVNRDFALRLAEAAEKDANANALVNLDCFASMVPLAIEDTLEELKGYFSAYIT